MIFGLILLFGSVGSTQINTDRGDLLSDIKNITLSSFAFEAARPVGLNEKDSFHIGLLQTLRVEKGNAKMLILYFMKPMVIYHSTIWRPI